MSVDRRLVALFLGVLAIVPGCVPPPEDNDRLIRFRGDTAMGQIQKRGTLVVGLESETAPIADTAPEEPQGFAVDLASDIAASLGVEIHFVSAPLLDLLDGVAGKNDVALDVAFPVVPLTELGVFFYAFSDPYFVGHQRLLTPSGTKLGPASVICLVDDPWASADHRWLDSFAEVSGPKPASDCLAMLASGTADAATATDVILARMAGNLASFEITGEQMSTEGYGVAVRDDLPGLAEYVNTVLAEAKLEGRWSEWYGEWFEAHLGPMDPPTLTGEDAAALYPVELDTNVPSPSPSDG